MSEKGWIVGICLVLTSYWTFNAAGLAGDPSQSSLTSAAPMSLVRGWPLQSSSIQSEARQTSCCRGSHLETEGNGARICIIRFSNSLFVLKSTASCCGGLVHMIRLMRQPEATQYSIPEPFSPNLLAGHKLPGRPVRRLLSRLRRPPCQRPDRHIAFGLRLRRSQRCERNLSDDGSMKAG
jgi:hypothetical protein